MFKMSYLWKEKVFSYKNMQDNLKSLVCCGSRYFKPGGGKGVLGLRNVGYVGAWGRGSNPWRELKRIPFLAFSEAPLEKIDK